MATQDGEYGRTDHSVVENRQAGSGAFAFVGVVIVLAMLGYFVLYTRPLVPIPVNDATISLPNRPTVAPAIPVTPATPAPVAPMSQP